MTKPLKQIQQENRKFILEAIHGCSYEEALKKEYAKKGNNTIAVPFREYDGEELTLSRVLLAFKNKEVKTCYGDEAIFNIGLVDFYEIESGAYRENHHFEYICDWDLKKETLEEQSEETQRAINEFFNN